MKSKMYIVRTQHAMVYGLELGVWFAASFVLQAQQGAGMQFLRMLVQMYVLYGIYKSAVNYRETELDGVISYGEVVRYVLNLFFCAAVVAALIDLVYLLWLAPNLLPDMMEQSMQVLIDSGMKITDEMKESMRMLMLPQKYVFFNIFAEMLLGLMIAIPMGFIVRKKKANS